MWRGSSGGATDGGLIHEAEFRNGFETGDGVVRSGRVFGVMEMPCECFGEDVVCEGGFSASGGAGENDDPVEGYGDGEVAEVVLACADDF